MCRGSFQGSFKGSVGVPFRGPLRIFGGSFKGSFKGSIGVPLRGSLREL